MQDMWHASLAAVHIEVSSSPHSVIVAQQLKCVTKNDFQKHEVIHRTQYGVLWQI